MEKSAKKINKKSWSRTETQKGRRTEVQCSLLPAVRPQILPALTPRLVQSIPSSSVLESKGAFESRGTMEPKPFDGSSRKFDRANSNRVLRDLIREYFKTKQRANPRYSMRALSLHLKVNQSFLSKFLKGDRRFSPKMVKRLGTNMGYSPAQLASVLGASPEHDQSYQRLEEDQFQTIADWLPFAILEALKIESLDGSPSLLAKHLGVHVDLVREASERLHRLQFIELTQNQRLKLKTTKVSWSQLASTDGARVKLQKQLNEKSTDALEKIDYAQRYHGSVTLALDENKFAEFRERYRNLVYEFADQIHLESKPSFNQVYQIVFALFPLSVKASADVAPAMKTKNKNPKIKKVIKKKENS